MRDRGFKMILMGVAALLALGAVVMLLWNWLLTSIAGLPVINYWQALGLFALCRILFGRLGWGGMPHRHPPMDHHKLHEKWHNMTDEERREFIEKRRDFMRGRPFPKPHHHHTRRDEHDDFTEDND